MRQGKETTMAINLGTPIKTNLTDILMYAESA